MDKQHLIVAAFVLLMPPSTTLAQQPPVSESTIVSAEPIPAGARVRVLAPAISEVPIVGQLVASDGSTLTVLSITQKGLGWPFHQASETTLTMPRESVIRLERSVRPSRKGLGKLVGMGVGVVAAVLINSPHSEGQGAELLTIPLGAGLGWLVAPGERWAAADPGRVSIDRRAVADAKNLSQVRVGIAPCPRGGVGVQLLVAF